MTELTYHDTTWRAELMGSEGWAVFVGPRMLASCLAEHQARFIVTACNCHADLLEALKAVRGWIGPNVLQFSRKEIVEIIEQAIHKAEEMI